MAWHADTVHAHDADLVRGLAVAVRLSGRATTMTTGLLDLPVGSNLQVAALLTIDREPGIRPSELAERNHVARPSMSRALRSLLQAGLVESSTDSADRRARRLRLSAVGHERLRCFWRALHELARGPEVTQLPSLLGGRASPGRPLSLGGAWLRAGDQGTRTFLGMTAAIGRAGPRRPAQVWVLLSLHSALVAPRPASLATWLAISRPAMTAHLDALERTALIRRRKGGGRSDGRRIEIVLTPRGRRAAESALDAFAVDAPRIGTTMADLERAATASELDAAGEVLRPWGSLLPPPGARAR